MAFHLTQQCKRIQVVVATAEGNCNCIWKRPKQRKRDCNKSRRNRRTAPVENCGYLAKLVSHKARLTSIPVEHHLGSHKAHQPFFKVVESQPPSLVVHLEVMVVMQFFKV